eukprot:g44402.t1
MATLWRRFCYSAPTTAPGFWSRVRNSNIGYSVGIIKPAFSFVTLGPEQSLSIRKCTCLQNRKGTRTGSQCVLSLLAKPTLLERLHDDRIREEWDRIREEWDRNCFLDKVYCICCSRCDLLYIGETKQRLGDHFVDHLHSVHDKRQHLPVTNHFNCPSHSLDDMSILGLLQYHNDATQKLEEQ